MPLEQYMRFTIFTGIDYLHPDLASNYVSIHYPVLYNMWM